MAHSQQSTDSKQCAYRRNPNDGSYVGRFAPSPSGPLHFGSLIGALASYCDARANAGRWLVRMEDLDPPREQPGAATAILLSLEAHGLQWDGEVLYQSQRHDAYRAALQQLQQAGMCYPCFCSRKALQPEGPVYQRHCLHKQHSEEDQYQGRHAAAIRVKTPTAIAANRQHCVVAFNDIFFGQRSIDIDLEVGDFIIRRKDGLFAYQLAVVVDDAFQNISHVIRGSDLLDSTPAQIYLQQCLHLPTPVYGHFPVASNRRGQKLSKQHHAQALNDRLASENLFHALEFLQQQPPRELLHAAVADVIAWGCAHWERVKIPATMELLVDSDNSLRQ